METHIVENSLPYEPTEKLKLVQDSIDHLFRHWGKKDIEHLLGDLRNLNNDLDNLLYGKSNKNED